MNQTLMPKILRAEFRCPYCDKYGVAVGFKDQYIQAQVDAIALDNLLKEHHDHEDYPSE